MNKITELQDEVAAMRSETSPHLTGSGCMSPEASLEDRDNTREDLWD